MTLTVRAATLTNFEHICTECGLDPQALISEVGLPRRCFVDPDIEIPAIQAMTLLELAAQRSREPAFGLRMALSRRLSNLGTLGLLLRDQPTLWQTLETLVNHIHLHNPALSLTLVETKDVVCIREDVIHEGKVATVQSVEMAVGTTFRLLRFFLGERWRPKLICFRHAKPHNTTWHLKVFGEILRFGQDFDEIVCNARDLEAPNPAADPVMARYSQQLLAIDTGAHTTVTSSVRKLIVFLLPRGHCHAEMVAEQLAVSRRTLHNHLAREGNTFMALVDEMRRDLLKRYLENNQRSLSEVAGLLGFSELSAFSRWHKNQFNVTASEHKRRNNPSEKVSTHTIAALGR